MANVLLEKSNISLGIPWITELFIWLWLCKNESRHIGKPHSLYGCRRWAAVPWWIHLGVLSCLDRVDIPLVVFVYCSLIDHCLWRLLLLCFDSVGFIVRTIAFVAAEGVVLWLIGDELFFAVFCVINWAKYFWVLFRFTRLHSTALSLQPVIEKLLYFLCREPNDAWSEDEISQRVRSTVCKRKE